MVVPAAVAQKFQDESASLGVLEGIVRQTLDHYCKQREFGFAIRVKRPDSVAEKLESGRYARWSELDDLVACTVVVPAYSYEKAVLEFLRSAFAEHECKARGATKKAPDAFRFDSTRFICRLRPQPGLDRHPVVESTLVEVQIRTAFEHAWSTATHALVYKGPNVDWGKLRLAAQLKAAVEQIDLLILGFEESAELIATSSWADVDDQRRIQQLLVEKVETGAVPREFEPKDWTTLAGNLHGLLRKAAGSRSAATGRVDQALAAWDAELTVNKAAALPVGCSLGQIAVGVLVAKEVIKKKPAHFTPLITPEMELAFQDLDRLGTPFDFDG